MQKQMGKMKDKVKVELSNYMVMMSSLYLKS